MGIEPVVAKNLSAASLPPALRPIQGQPDFADWERVASSWKEFVPDAAELAASARKLRDLQSKYRTDDIDKLLKVVETSNRRIGVDGTPWPGMRRQWGHYHQMLLGRISATLAMRAVPCQRIEPSTPIVDLTRHEMWTKSEVHTTDAGDLRLTSTDDVTFRCESNSTTGVPCTVSLWITKNGDGIVSVVVSAVMPRRSMEFLTAHINKSKADQDLEDCQRTLELLRNLPRDFWTCLDALPESCATLAAQRLKELGTISAAELAHVDPTESHPVGPLEWTIYIAPFMDDVSVAISSSDHNVDQALQEYDNLLSAAIEEEAGR